MHPPRPEPFNATSLEDLSREIKRLGLELPLSGDLSLLASPLPVGERMAPNRLCVQPLEGNDGDGAGAPGELTLRRYLHFAGGGFGMIWFEATAVEEAGRSSPRQLWLNPGTVSRFAALVRAVRETARIRRGSEPVLILQLSHAGRYARPRGATDPVLVDHQSDRDRRQGIPDDYPLISDGALDQLQESYVAAARLAVEAGFDGVDIKACHGDLVADLLAACTRPGKYGGDGSSRTRFLRETLAKVGHAVPRAILATRFTADGGGASPDITEPVALARELARMGVGLMSVTMEDESDDGEPRREDPLLRLARQVAVTRVIQRAVPEVPVVGGGYTGLRQFMPDVAAGVLCEGGAALIGIGRGALAYPDLAGDLLGTGKMDPDKCCVECSACIQMLKDGGMAGCAVMDSAVYGEEYRHRRRFALDHLREEARRCRDCRPAPCRTACPARIDVSGFLKAFAGERTEAAFDILRQQNVLPEMCSHLCPVGRMCEGHCVEGILTGSPIPIHDIQYAVCWLARGSGLAGLKIPQAESGRRVAVVGGGPAGVACAATLLGRGHTVVIFERAERLGGTPEQLIRASRFTGAREEVEALLQPALREGRLAIRFGCELGAGVSLQDLRRDYDAVFLATGVWKERTLGVAEGVVDAVSFLKQVRSGGLEAVPPKVVLLAGGDCAMDSAVVALELGARDLTIVYAGELSDMHWHMPDSWFRTKGVQFMTRTRPLGYRVDADGRLTGVEVRLGQGVETVLEAELVLEAMGLGVEEQVQVALEGCEFDRHGLLKTAGNGSLACGPSGVFAGGGLVNGGAAVVQCIEEGMRAGREMDVFLRSVAGPFRATR